MNFSRAVFSLFICVIILPKSVHAQAIHPETKVPAVDLEYQKALAQEKSGDFKQALGSYQKILKEHPNSYFSDEMGMSVDDQVKGRIQIINCRLNRKEESFKKWEEAEIHITKAIKAEDADNLLKLASCEFSFSKCGTDDSFWVKAQDIIPVILQSAKNWDWENIKRQPRPDNVWIDIISKSNKTSSALYIKKMKDGWQWASSCSTDNKVVAHARN